MRELEPETPLTTRGSCVQLILVTVRKTRDVRFVKDGLARALRTAASRAPEDQVVPLSPQMVRLRFAAAARAARTAAAPGRSTVVTTTPTKRRETPEPSEEPQPSPRRTRKGPITHDLDETRSQDIPWSLCGVLLYDPTQIAKAGEPATCGKCQRFRSAASYRKRQAAMKAAKKVT